MQSNYYYLIASLPSSGTTDLQELYDHIMVNLSQEDARLFRYFGHVHDNYNLISVLGHKYKNLDLTRMVTPANFNMQELKDEQLLLQLAPDYMFHFYQELKVSFETTTIREWETILWTNFYEEIAKIDDHFLNCYFQHEQIIANTLRVTVAQEFYPKSDTAKQENNLHHAYEDWQQPLQLLLKERKPDEISSWIRDHRLEITEGLSSVTSFDRNRVFHHFLHIQRQSVKLNRATSDAKADFQKVKSAVLGTHAPLKQLLI
jgi:hypothetical protein